jgi:hypothetical protein
MTTKQKQHARMWDYGYEADGSDIQVDLIDLPENVQDHFKRIFQDPTYLDEIELN